MGPSWIKFRYRKETGRNWFTNSVVNAQQRLSEHVNDAKTNEGFVWGLNKYKDEEGRL